MERLQKMAKQSWSSFQNKLILLQKPTEVKKLKVKRRVRVAKDSEPEEPEVLMSKADLKKARNQAHLENEGDKAETPIESQHTVFSDCWD